VNAEQMKQRAGELVEYLKFYGFGSLTMGPDERDTIVAILRAVAGGADTVECAFCGAACDGVLVIKGGKDG
jgi:hypothetical protein